MEPEEIPVQQLTHLIVAFGYVTPGDFRLTNVSKNKNQISDRADRYYMDGVSTDMYERLPKLKSKNPNLKVMIAWGGWTFNDLGHGKAFSQHGFIFFHSSHVHQEPSWLPGMYHYLTRDTLLIIFYRINMVMMVSTLT